MLSVHAVSQLIFTSQSLALTRVCSLSCDDPLLSSISYPLTDLDSHWNVSRYSVSYDAGAEALDARLGDRLRSHGVSPKLLFYSWVCSTERDYSYLSQIKQYKPFFEILSYTFVRVLFQAGVPDPENFATKDDVMFVMEEYKKLRARPGMGEMMRILREGGFEVWCCSDANIERVKGYFDNAGVEMPLDHILSADMCAAGKPEAAVYKMAREKAGSDKEGEISVFAASHAWDCAAAKSAG
jgi:2-haloacid dehalogenase